MTAALFVQTDQLAVLARGAVNEFGRGPSSLSFALSASGIGGLAVIGAALIVDRRGPHPLLGVGALIVALGLLFIGLSGNFPGFIAGSIVVGIGSAAIGNTVLFAVAAKGCYRYRGTVIGLLAAVMALNLGRIAELGVTNADWKWEALISAAPAIAAALALFFLLPRVFPVRERPGWMPPWRDAAADDPSVTWRRLQATPGFWRVLAAIVVVFALGGALQSAITVSGKWLHFERFGEPLGVTSLGLAPALGAVAWGIASDYFPARRLIALAGLIGASMAPLLLLDSRAASVLADILFGVSLGGLRVLLWVLLADRVGVRYLASIGVGVTFAGGVLANILTIPAASLALQRLGPASLVGMAALLAVGLAFASMKVPRSERRLAGRSPE